MLEVLLTPLQMLTTLAINSILIPMNLTRTAVGLIARPESRMPTSSSLRHSESDEPAPTVQPPAMSYPLPKIKIAEPTGSPQSSKTLYEPPVPPPPTPVTEEPPRLDVQIMADTTGPEELAKDNTARTTSEGKATPKLVQGPAPDQKQTPEHPETKSSPPEGRTAEKELGSGLASMEELPLTSGPENKEAAPGFESENEKSTPKAEFPALKPESQPQRQAPASPALNVTEDPRASNAQLQSDKGPEAPPSLNITKDPRAPTLSTQLQSEQEPPAPPAPAELPALKPVRQPQQETPAPPAPNVTQDPGAHALNAQPQSQQGPPAPPAPVKLPALKSEPQPQQEIPTPPAPKPEPQPQQEPPAPPAPNFTNDPEPSARNTQLQSEQELPASFALDATKDPRASISNAPLQSEQELPDPSSPNVKKDPGPPAPSAPNVAKDREAPALYTQRQSEQEPPAPSTPDATKDPEPPAPTAELQPEEGNSSLHALGATNNPEDEATADAASATDDTTSTWNSINSLKPRKRDRFRAKAIPVLPIKMIAGSEIGGATVWLMKRKAKGVNITPAVEALKRGGG